MILPAWWRSAISRDRTERCRQQTFSLVLFVLGVLLSGLALSIAPLSCAKRQVAPRPGAEFAVGEDYDIAWVDPRVVISDSLFTVIYAERVDSFAVDGSGHETAGSAPSLVFRITEVECFVWINLASATGEVIKPLLVRNLPPGFYKLTLDVGHMSRRYGLEKRYVLTADVCGDSIEKPVRYGVP